MRKVYIALLGLFFYLSGNPEDVRAQYPASSYGFTAAAGTFTEITGGNIISDIEADDDISGTLPIGFSFNYCGVIYTNFLVSSNGWLSFNYTGTSSENSNSTSNLEDIAPAVFPLWDDLSGSVGSASYITTGTAPNRVLTVEYKNWRWNYSSSFPATISFQIKLYETTNVIEFVYRQETSTGNPSGATIGIGDDQTPNTYLNLNNTSTNPTSSSTTFTTNIDQRPATGQIYRFTPPAPCSNVSGLPTASSTEVSDTVICYSTALNLSYVPNTPLPAATGFSYLWQTAPALTGPWTDIDSSLTADFSTNVSSDGYFRAILVCNGTTYLDTASPSPFVQLNSPQLTGTTGASRCGPGSLDLSATTTGSNSVLWFATATGGAPLGTGTSFSTPYLTSTTDFFAAAVGGSSADSINVPLTNGTTTGSYHHMFLVEAITGLTLNSISIKCNMSVGTNSDWEIYYRPDNYQLVAGANTSATGWTLLATATNIPSAGSSAYTEIATGLGIAIPAGESYSFYIAPASGTTHQYATTTTGTVTATSADAQLIAGNRGSSLFNCTTNGGMAVVKIDYSTGCESPRTPVTATITPGPAFEIASDTLICNDAVTQISVSSPLSNYSSYVWDDPNNELYTNAAATTPYAGGNASTVYFRSTVAEGHQFAVAATNGPAPTDCSAADTAHIWVQPADAGIDAMPDTICVSGAAELALAPDSGYAAGSIQWQESPNGSAYSNVQGANTPFYTTPVLSTEHYYKAIVRWQHGVCDERTKHLVIADPQVLSTKDSFNCGPGEVYLEGTAGTNSALRWYEAPEGGLPLATGNQFTTPMLQETDTFWVGAGVGGGSIPPTFIGSGTSTTSSSYSPFYHLYETQKTQMLITAAELTAAGFTAGMITHIGFDIESASSSLPPYENLNISAKNTTVTALTTTFETGMTPLFTQASFVPVDNQVNDFALTTPFAWDGSSNLIIELCYASNDWGSPSPTLRYTSGLGFAATHYQYADGSPNQCTSPNGTNGTSTSRVNIQLTITTGCESPREPVVAFIHPDPEVDLGNDINNCVDSGAVVVLDAGTQPNSPVFRWDDNSAGQVRAVNTSGDYYVEVTNLWGCAESDTISVTLRENPVVELGNDTSICEDVSITLDAGSDGIEYFWNNGMTEQVILVEDSGSYIVLVTNDQGCTRSDTIHVDINGQLPTVQGIDITNNGASTFTFNAINPQHVIGYEWDFGDGSAPSYQQVPTHTYAPGDGDYVVTLTLSSTCGFISDSTSAHIVGIGDLDLGKEELLIYPNPTRERATIKNKSVHAIEQIEVFNLLGQRVYSKKADSRDQHVLELNQLASGIYQVQIYTSGGRVNRKLEMLR